MTKNLDRAPHASFGQNPKEQQLFFRETFPNTCNELVIIVAFTFLDITRNKSWLLLWWYSIEGQTAYLIDNKPTFPPKTYFLNYVFELFLELCFRIISRWNHLMLAVNSSINIFIYVAKVVDCPTQLMCTWVFMTKLKEHSREICYRKGRPIEYLGFKHMLVLSDCCSSFPANSLSIFFWDLDWKNNL